MLSQNPTTCQLLKNYHPVCCHTVGSVIFGESTHIFFFYGELHPPSNLGLILGQDKQSEEIKRQLMMVLGHPSFIFFFLVYLA